MSEPTDSTRPSRRRILGWAGASGLAAATVAAGATAVLTATDPVDPPAAATGPRTISPYGDHQTGITEPMARAVRVLALDLRPDVDADALGRLMRLWTADVAALMTGRPAPGETAPDLAQPGVDLSVTVGWGPRLFDIIARPGDRPRGLTDVPRMTHDRLRAAWSGGDLLVLIGADDDTSVTHAARRMVLDARPFAQVRWEQQGSWRGRDAAGRPTTGRNLFGQVDGTGNPAPGTPSFDHTVWSREHGWFAGGTTVVVRRIEMDLRTWDQLTRNEQERTIGRNLTNGAPLSGERETDPLDLHARDHRGALAIPPGAHARLAHPSANGGRLIYRKGANFTEAGPQGRSGLIFLSHQADIAEQFTPMQQRLDRLDDLNTWTTAVGSAVFALLPGFTADTWLGQTLLG